MVRFHWLLIVGLLSTAAWGEPGGLSVTLGQRGWPVQVTVGNQGYNPGYIYSPGQQPPPGYYWCQQHGQYCNHQQGVPAGHYYCDQHRQYCSHGRNYSSRRSYGRVPAGYYRCEKHGQYCNHGGGHQNQGRGHQNHGRGHQIHAGGHQNQGDGHCPPGHYYCNRHGQFCSHR
ncbi:MAG: hypothetical protein HY319_01785 [Armatimonadetes bacterium]|nr:hypothetical protein [Armatimonadota bacterium]